MAHLSLKWIARGFWKSLLKSSRVRLTLEHWQGNIHKRRQSLLLLGCDELLPSSALLSGQMTLVREWSLDYWLESQLQGQHLLGWGINYLGTMSELDWAMA